MRRPRWRIGSSHCSANNPQAKATANANNPKCTKYKEKEQNNYHNTTIVDYFEQRLTNASAKSFNAKIKAFRSQFRGVSDIKFFMYRLSVLYS